MQQPEVHVQPANGCQGHADDCQELRRKALECTQQAYDVAQDGQVVGAHVEDVRHSGCLQGHGPLLGATMPLCNAKSLCRFQTTNMQQGVLAAAVAALVPFCKKVMEPAPLETAAAAERSVWFVAKLRCTPGNDLRDAAVVLEAMENVPFVLVLAIGPAALQHKRRLVFILAWPTYRTLAGPLGAPACRSTCNQRVKCGNHKGLALHQKGNLVECQLECVVRVWHCEAKHRIIRNKASDYDLNKEADLAGDVEGHRRAAARAIKDHDLH